MRGERLSSASVCLPERWGNTCSIRRICDAAWNLFSRKNTGDKIAGATDLGQSGREKKAHRLKPMP